MSGTSGRPNGRTPPFPRTGTGQTPSKFQVLFGEKKRRRREDGPPTPFLPPFHQPCVSPQTCPPSLIETSLVRNSLAQSSDRCTHGSGIQKVGTSSGQIGLTKMVLSGRPLRRAKSPRINRPRLRSDGVDSYQVYPYIGSSTINARARPSTSGLPAARCVHYIHSSTMHFCMYTVMRAVPFDTETLSILFPRPDGLGIWMRCRSRARCGFPSGLGPWGRPSRARLQSGACRAAVLPPRPAPSCCADCSM